MTNLFFRPKSVAVIGASRDPHSVGYGIIQNLTKGCIYNCRYCRPYHGKIYLVNPSAQAIAGLPCYKSVHDIPDKVDLAIVAVPAKVVPEVVREALNKGVKALIIISSGFAETGKKGKHVEEYLVRLAHKKGARIVGPNCLGIIRPPDSLNASFAPSMPPVGPIGFISQSGALADSVIDWAIEERYGFSAIVSVGNASDLDISDFLEILMHDKHTRSIAVYTESIKNGKKFVEIAKRVAKKKPIVVLKGGKTAQGSSAATSHTGALAGSYKIYEAAFRKAGVHSANSVEELFDVAKALANQPPAPANGIAIVTNGGGCGVLAADHCERLGVKLVELSKNDVEWLNPKMHPAWSKRNPVDIIGDARPEQYKAAIDRVLSKKDVAGLMVIQTLQTTTDPEKDAEIVINAHRAYPKKPVVCAYMGGKFSKESIRTLEEAGIPDYNDLRKASRAMKALIEQGYFLRKAKQSLQVH